MLSLTGTLQVNRHVRLPLSTRGVPGCVGLRHGSTKAAKYVA
jgi:hypothetical protein